MKKDRIIALLAVLLLALGLAACGGGNETAADKAAAEQPAAEAQVAETHDCDGGCGMTAVPVDKLTLINGKYYCAGCATKVQEGGETEEGHEGHDHG